MSQHDQQLFHNQKDLVDHQNHEKLKYEIFK
jgi:hypothetical protein